MLQTNTVFFFLFTISALINVIFAKKRDDVIFYTAVTILSLLLCIGNAATIAGFTVTR